MKKYLLPLILLFTTFTTHANETPYNPQGTWWVNVGYGFGWLVSHTVDNEEADNTENTQIFNASANYALFDNQYIELRSAQSGNFLNFLTCLFGCSERLDGIDDVGLLYGIMKKEKWYMVGAAAGLAYTELEYKSGERVYDPSTNSYTTEHTYRNSATVGIPLEAQLFFTPFKYVGIGLVGLANFNTEGSVAGVLLALQVGKLRP